MTDTFNLTMGTKTADTEGPAAVVVVIEQGAFKFCTALTSASARDWSQGLATCADELDTLSLLEGGRELAGGETTDHAQDFIRQVFDADEFARFCADPERRAMMRTLLDSLDEEDSP